MFSSFLAHSQNPRHHLGRSGFIIISVSVKSEASTRAVVMGFGAMLVDGCAVDTGLSGGSALFPST